MPEDEKIRELYSKIISVNDYPKSDLKELFNIFKKTFISAREEPLREITEYKEMNTYNRGVYERQLLKKDKQIEDLEKDLQSGINIVNKQIKEIAELKDQIKEYKYMNAHNRGVYEEHIKSLECCGNCGNVGYHRPDDCNLCKNYKYGNTENNWKQKKDV